MSIADILGPSLCLIATTLIILSISVRENLHSFINNPDTRISLSVDHPSNNISSNDISSNAVREVNEINLVGVVGIILLISMVLVGFFVLIKYFSLKLIIIIFLISIGITMFNCFMDLIDSKEVRSILSICSLSYVNEGITVRFLVSILTAGILIVTYYMTHNWIVNNIIAAITVIDFHKQYK